MVDQSASAEDGAEQELLEHVRAKYREERDKRLAAQRPGGAALTGDLARYLDDPYTSAASRDSVSDEVDAVVVGAGFGGLVVGARLREAGLERIRLIDTAGDVGGVWYWNRYPGAMCDVESYIYLPLLEEVGTIPEWKYANAPVILDHARVIAKHYGLYDLSLFHTAVTSATWDDAASRWRLRTDRGDWITARLVVFGIGSLAHPRLPAIPGVGEFGGPSFHTSRWDYTVTGGQEDANLTGLHDKVVGIIGTGATAIQCVPPLGRGAERLYVFQRTPSTVAPRNNKRVDKQWAASLSKGWQRERMMNFLNCIDPKGHADVDLVDDGWTEVYRRLMFNPLREQPSGMPLAEATERADYEWMEKIRARVDGIVTDKATAEALMPWYAYFCKRPGFHDEYLATFNLPSVTLVDTQGVGIERVYEGGVIANGRKYPLDVLIFATGFEAGETTAPKFGCTVTGRDGITLHEKWSAGLRTFHGVMTAGFPNLLFTSAIASQATRSPNFMHTLVDNADHFGHIVERVLERGASTFEVTPEAEDQWVRLIVSGARDRREFLEACTPGRPNHDGHLDEARPGYVDFGGGVLEFLKLMADWRGAGNLSGLALA